MDVESQLWLQVGAAAPSVKPDGIKKNVKQIKSDSD